MMSSVSLRRALLGAMTSSRASLARLGSSRARLAPARPGATPTAAGRSSRPARRGRMSSCGTPRAAATLSSPPASERPSPDPPGPLDHARHRDAVLSQLPPGKLVYVPAGKAQTRNGVEGNARFRQEPDFLYLTGVEEPGYHALFGTGADAPFVLIAPRQDPEMDVWCGKQASRDELRAVTGADNVYYDDEFHKALDAVEAQEGQTVFVPSHDAAGLPNDPDGLFLGLRPETTALGKVMAKARSLKTSEEIDCLRFANEVSGDAHVAMWRHAARAFRVTNKGAPGQLWEHELEAVFAGETMKRGLRHLGYPSIVGAGAHAATLHYERNDARVRSADDLVLVDAGAEWRGYTADITRTFPAGGKFEARRRAVYEAVLDVQVRAIAEMRAGANWQMVGARAKLNTVQNLIDLGIVRGNAQDAVMAGVCGLFLPHSLGHLLGLQVHDVGPGGPVPDGALAPGHVVTCEPGIYFVDGLLEPALEDRFLKDFLVRDEIERFKAVGGVRIEDNVAITEDGAENLTTCPKTVEEIEAICRDA